MKNVYVIPLLFSLLSSLSLLPMQSALHGLVQRGVHPSARLASGVASGTWREMSPHLRMRVVVQDILGNTNKADKELSRAVDRVVRDVAEDTLARVASNPKGFWRLAAFLRLGINPNGVLLKDDDLPGHKGRSRWVPLHEAARNNCAQNIKLLLAYGADIHAVDYWGNEGQALHIAAKHHAYKAVEVLLDAGADANSGYTPLGADANSRYTPLQAAIHGGWISATGLRDRDFLLTRNLLLKHTHYHPKLLQAAIDKGDWRTVKAIVRTYNKVLADEPSLLVSAYNKLDMIVALLKAGVNPNAPGLLPLHEHARDADMNSVAILRLLVAAKTHLNTQDEQGRTALMIAARGNDSPNNGTPGGNVEGVKILVNAGASQSLRCTRGLTAMDYAIKAANPLNFDVIDGGGRQDIPFPEKDRQKALQTYEDILSILRNNTGNIA